jgi:hypothetical protein
MMGIERAWRALIVFRAEWRGTVDKDNRGEDSCHDLGQQEIGLKIDARGGRSDWGREGGTKVESTEVGMRKRKTEVKAGAVERLCKTRRPSVHAISLRSAPVSRCGNHVKKSTLGIFCCYSEGLEGK